MRGNCGSDRASARRDAAIFGQKAALRCLLARGSDPEQCCASFDGERTQTLLEFLGDDARVEGEVREILRVHQPAGAAVASV
jgi:hypothetical protein